MTAHYLPAPPEPSATPLDRWLDRLGTLFGAALWAGIVLAVLWAIGVVR